jgi:hypothetical protein
MINRTELQLMLLEVFFEKSTEELIELAETDLGLELLESNEEDDSTFVGVGGPIELSLESPDNLKACLEFFSQALPVEARGFSREFNTGRSN